MMTARDELYEALTGTWTPRTGSMTPDDLVDAYRAEITRIFDQERRYICGCPPDDRPISLEK